MLSWRIPKTFHRSSKESMPQSLPALRVTKHFLISAFTRKLHLERRREPKNPCGGYLWHGLGGGKDLGKNVCDPGLGGGRRVTTAVLKCRWHVALCSHPAQGTSRLWVKPGGDRCEHIEASEGRGRQGSGSHGIPRVSFVPYQVTLLNPQDTLKK